MGKHLGDWINQEMGTKQGDPMPQIFASCHQVFFYYLLQLDPNWKWCEIAFCT